MSEFTDKQDLRVDRLSHYILGLLAGEKGDELLKKYQVPDSSFTALDVMMALDKVMHMDEDMIFCTRAFLITRNRNRRKVQNCHPHESVHVVTRILEAFKKG